ncbi:DUF3037 domain-containing protein [Flaviaesturariibacter amylovorans]|uniref:DUF3037 domain-containing protein n=1 Tax=Flaviaesturariibacter amylovorans TaxID=1084520 RepID=A0ABP8GPU8_9BACT
MPGTLLYEYAVLRAVPRVEREEFLNVGVVLYCRQRRSLEVRIHLDERRLLALAPAADAGNIGAFLDAFARICHGEPGAGPIAALDAASRFRWLTATRSTVLQCSKVHPGLCNDPVETLDRLYRELVL